MVWVWRMAGRVLRRPRLDSDCVAGAESWPPGVSLKYIGGDQFGHVNAVMVKSLEPQEVSDVSVQMRSPAAPGMYQGQWRMCTSTGLFYGGRHRRRRRGHRSFPGEFSHSTASAFLLPPLRRDLGDPQRGSRGSPRRHPAAVLVRDGVQHAAPAQRAGRLQPLRLAAEEQARRRRRRQQLQRARRRLGPDAGADPAGSKRTVSQCCK